MSERSQTGPGGAGHIPMLRGARVWLRPSEASDIDRFLAWLNDAETSRYLSLRSPLSRAAEERWFERLVEEQGKTVFHFVICLAVDDRAIGTIGLMEIDYVNGSAGVGIAIGEPALWGQGLGTDAMDAILDFAFGQLRLERVWLDLNTDNVRARRSYEKSGFVLEGTKRHAYYSDGRPRDLDLMSIIRAEWRALTRPRTWDLSERDAAARRSNDAGAGR